MATIQWYPGHMAKAKKQVQENLHLVDIVLEIVDARTPNSSRNPILDKIIEQKPRLMILNKADLADPVQSAAWIKEFTANGLPAIALDSQHNKGVQQIEKMAQQILHDKIKRQHERGIKNKPIRAICIGIPNAGKSTILNRLVKKNVAQTGDRPGVTKKQQWLKAGKNMELLDTPGILWPKFEDPLVGKKLALTGAIKDSIYHADDVALYALDHFKATNPQLLLERYRLAPEDLNLSTADLLLKITQRMGLKDDFDRASERLILEIRKNKLGRYTLDTPGDEING
ncbi:MULTISPECIES: ribosome biogenesis GTPase YlqF [Loigolactobacillus]|uniref:Ribosome biogenesis GTPase A n=1 Tax=Loigolactobacillus backii TaxID=375175 RepID=A0A192H3L3_9LACO|nr:MULTISPECIES: ribosome biogenesis GTPase YlqF [Loigolactobacillus]ANK59478.1 ribosome biogenesis GTPase YlqF [Loigolactobacillus backii]ANK62960.1 ribosome biogenesis GTPase YlqF [Loigolactobacillus backii]ANK64471.1 ribosome biogenesis GTPase YlqF [Loigolactobacillus backii]ANK67133.1 ribosome biogenesis GTPase YlqF [Loigolactobacillus backii]ANK70032.1 ribosome biogenesis GTPase YlqF [Loigolactobacillus backii]